MIYLKEKKRKRGNINPADSSTTNYLYVFTDIDQELAQILHNRKINTLRNLEEELTSNEVQISVYKEMGNSTYSQIYLSNKDKVTIYQPLNSEINETLYQYYQSKGIDIYNPNDKAFTESCYYNDNFDYDLTQKYRRTTVYQNKTFTSSNCNYTGYDIELGYIKLECYVSDSYIFTDKELDIEDIEHLDNLPTKCGGNINNLSNNIAFWLFLVLILIFIVMDIFMLIISLRNDKGNNIEVALLNDELIERNQNNKFHQVMATENIKSLENDKVQPEEVIVEFQSQLAFGQIVMKNLCSLHPISTLCKSSILMPIVFNIWIFIYNIFILFGFNAVYFNETMIEDRITNKSRNDFVYPMKTEFEKIMASIATSIALTIIVRAISLVTMTKKTELSNNLNNAKSNEEKQSIANNFAKSYLARRIISGIFMLALIVFFFYYCVVFCGIYIKTQYGWFYSGI